MTEEKVETIFDNINPIVLEKVKSLRLIDDELMTLVFSGKFSVKNQVLVEKEFAIIRQ